MTNKFKIYKVVIDETGRNVLFYLVTPDGLATPEIAYKVSKEEAGIYGIFTGIANHGNHTYISHEEYMKLYNLGVIKPIEEYKEQQPVASAMKPEPVVTVPHFKAQDEDDDTTSESVIGKAEFNMKRSYTDDYEDDSTTSGSEIGVVAFNMKGTCTFKKLHTKHKKFPTLITELDAVQAQIRCIKNDFDPYNFNTPSYETLDFTEEDRQKLRSWTKPIELSQLQIVSYSHETKQQVYFPIDWQDSAASCIQAYEVNIPDTEKYTKLSMYIESICYNTVISKYKKYFKAMPQELCEKGCQYIYPYLRFCKQDNKNSYVFIVSKKYKNTVTREQLIFGKDCCKSIIRHIQTLAASSLKTENPKTIFKLYKYLHHFLGDDRLDTFLGALPLKYQIFDKDHSHIGANYKCTTLSDYSKDENLTRTFLAADLKEDTCIPAALRKFNSRLNSLNEHQYSGCKPVYKQVRQMMFEDGHDNYKDFIQPLSYSGVKDRTDVAVATEKHYYTKGILSLAVTKDSNLFKQVDYKDGNYVIDDDVYANAKHLSKEVIFNNLKDFLGAEDYDKLIDILTQCESSLFNYLYRINDLTPKHVRVGNKTLKAPVVIHNEWKGKHLESIIL